MSYQNITWSRHINILTVKVAETYQTKRVSIFKAFVKCDIKNSTKGFVLTCRETREGNEFWQGLIDIPNDLVNGCYSG